MGHRLDRLHARSPLLVPALLLGATLAVERVTFQIGKNLLPLLVEEFGTLASYLPFAMGVGGVLGFLVFLLAGTFGAGRRWALAFLAGLVLGGALASFAPSVGVLLAATALTGLTGFGGSVLLASACEQLARDAERRDLNHRANALTEIVAPLLVAAATWLASDGDWRAAMAAGALLMPALAFVPLLGLHLADPAPIPSREARASLGQALGEARRQLREPAMLLSATAAALTVMAIAPYVSLMALAVVQDGIGLDVVAGLTLLGTPTALIGGVWERLFGARHRAALVASYLPAFGGWAIVLALELGGARWPIAVKIVLWGLSSVALRLAYFTTTLVARGLALSVGDGQLPSGTISVRSAIQAFPGSAAGMAALAVAPWLLHLGHGMAPIAAISLVLLTAAVCLMHQAHRTHRTDTDHQGGDHDA